VSHQDELDLLREEGEALADFLRMLQREYAHLQADFASALNAAGGQIRVEKRLLQALPLAAKIERVEDPATGAVTFRLRRPTP
jgi:hypothetical protein